MPGVRFGLARYSLSVGVSIGKKKYVFASDNEGFQKGMCKEENSDSQDIALVWGSVWERKCVYLHREMKVFRGECGRRKIRIRKI